MCKVKNILIGKLELSRLILSSVLSLIIGVSTIVLPGCGQGTITEPEIPAHFTTYTDESKLFSISYPPEWETALWAIEEIEESMEMLLQSVESDLPLETGGMIFYAGLPIKMGYLPNVNIAVDSLPESVQTLDEIVEAGTQVMKRFTLDYHKFSRVKTTIGEREAIIDEFETTYPQTGTYHQLQMTMLVGKNYWVATCTPPSGEFNKWEDNFNSIVRSLRILK